jgi:transcriptional regulator with XRE-family HTH domain
MMLVQKGASTMARGSARIPKFTEWRASRHLTQVDVANGADVSINTIRNAESGQRISPINLAKIAQFLGVTPEVLISRGPYDETGDNAVS